MTNVTVALSFSSILSTAILAGFGLTTGGMAGYFFYLVLIKLVKSLGWLAVGALVKLSDLFRK